MEMFYILIMMVVTQVCIYMSKLIALYTLKIGLLLTYVSCTSIKLIIKILKFIKKTHIYIIEILNERTRGGGSSG